jgi:glutathione S-transferase
MGITLYQFKPMFGLPNPSPFCMKLEIYLRMAGLAHTVVTLKGRPQSFTGKAPYVEIDGKFYADSGLIITHLEQTHGHPVDGKLTLAERATSLALRRLMEEHLYWVAVYMRWADPATRAQWRPYLQELLGLSGFMTSVVAHLSERRVMKTLARQGIGRHSPEVIWQMGIADIQALAHWLGNRPWGFGETPTVFDACLAAFIGNIAATPWDNPLTAAAKKHSNLTAHCVRLLGLYFPELSPARAES